MKKVILIFILVFTFLGGFLFFTNIVFAQGDFGLSDIAGKAKLKSGDLPTLSGQLLGAALSLVGVVFFLLMIYGGVLWMTARGNSQQTDKALGIIIAAVIGLIIVFGSYTFTKFLFKSVGNESASTTTTSGGICSNIGSPDCEDANCASYLAETECGDLSNGCCFWK